MVIVFDLLAATVHLFSSLPLVVVSSALLDARSLLFWSTIILLWWFGGAVVVVEGFHHQSREAAVHHHQRYPPSRHVLGGGGGGGDAATTNNEEERTRVIAYNKPPNVITSHSDPEAIKAVESRRTVYEDIQTLKGWVGTSKNDDNNNNNILPASSWQHIMGIHSKLHAIGRLDCDTTGLLLLTNDGGLVHHVTNPTGSSSTSTGGSTTKTITKTYQAVIMGYYDNDHPDFEIIRTEGVNIGSKYGGMTNPAIHLQVLDHPTPKSTLITITIGEGKNRQVRRMFHSIGSGVMKLQRTQIGEYLTLDGLGLQEIGQWRILSDQEVQLALNWRVRKIEQRKQQVVVKKKPRGGRKGRLQKRDGNSSNNTVQKRKTNKRQQHESGGAPKNNNKRRERNRRR